MGALAPIRWLGATTLGLLRGLLEVFSLFYGGLVVLLYARGRGAAVTWESTILQLRFTGVDALPLVGLAALALGTLIITEANTYLPVEYAASVPARILTKDVMPLVVAVVLIGRSGSAICVELAHQKLTGQLDALRAMGLVLEHVVVFPRLVAGVVCSVVLQIYGLLIALAGGYALSKALGGLPFALEALLAAISLSDLTVAALKALVFGAAIVLVSIREGYSVRRSTRELPQATTRAIVRSMGLCLLLNTAFSLLM